VQIGHKLIRVEDMNQQLVIPQGGGSAPSSSLLTEFGKTFGALSLDANGVKIRETRKERNLN